MIRKGKVIKNMKNKKSLYIIILVLVVIGGAVFFLSNNKNAEEGTPVPANENEMVDCGESKDPGCFVNRMNGCLPVTAKMMGSDGKTAIDITILGVENEKCHFQRKIDNVLSLDCYFPEGTMNMDTLDQTFGNDKGLQKVVDDNCKSGW
jgi:hypothetical protein